MDYMEFEEEIKDAQYFEEKIKILEERINDLEKMRILFDKQTKELQNDK